MLRAFQSVAAVIAVGAFAVVASTTGSAGCNHFCSDGFVRTTPGSDQQTCEGLCDKSLCTSSDDVCVDNQCTLVCTAHLDCQGGAQDCMPTKVDGTNASIMGCLSNGKGPIGMKCPFGTECTRSFACAGTGTACDPSCTTDCPCAASDCQIANPGAFACPDGKACDPDCTGASCACAAADCQALTCLSAGAGDADAYCTMHDCHADSDCPGGYWCEPTRDPHAICNTTPAKGNNSFCGKTTDPCVDPSAFSANGATFVEGSLCLQRNECRIRKECDPCTTDLDCSLIAGQHCSQVGAETVCTRDCTSDADCDQSYQCLSGACIPRFGACTGTGQFCEPCRNDGDCGGKDSHFACTNPNGDERICTDPKFSITCTTDADCPVAPSGVHGKCLDAMSNTSPSDPTYHTCFIPFFSTADRFSCWCGNPGSACSSASDCCSKKCGAADPMTGQRACL